MCRQNGSKTILRFSLSSTFYWCSDRLPDPLPRLSKRSWWEQEVGDSVPVTLIQERLVCAARAPCGVTEDGGSLRQGRLGEERLMTAEMALTQDTRYYGGLGRYERTSSLLCRSSASFPLQTLFGMQFVCSALC